MQITSLSRLGVVSLVLAAGCQSPAVTPTAPGTGGNGGTAGAGAGVRMDAGFVITGNRDGGPGGGPGTGPPNGGLEEGSCAEQVTRAMRAPVDLLLLVDSSSSMNLLAGSGMRTKWSVAVEALQLFVRDPRSAGMGMGLQFFPLVATEMKPCNSEVDCPVQPTGLPGYCLETSSCMGGAAPAIRCTMAQSRCPPGAACRPGGFCAVSRTPCAVDGQACPGGIPGDICKFSPTGKVCSLGGDSCDVADYGRLAVPIEDLPASEMLLTGALGGKQAAGGTPTAAAVKGALLSLRSRQMTNPDRKAALLLVTDGAPAGCPRNDVAGIAGDIAAARMGNPSILTYTIGAFSAPELAQGRMNLTTWASAGGTVMPFVIEAGDDLGMRLQAALAEIRGAALPCEFVIPPSATGQKLDYGKVNVKLKGATTPEETIPYVERADRCDPTRGGWYYDVNPMAGMPRRVIACEASCRKLKGEMGGTVSLTFGCATEVIQ